MRFYFATALFCVLSVSVTTCPLTQEENRYPVELNLPDSMIKADYLTPCPKVEMLRRIYDDIDDVELMVAIYTEKLMPGTWVGPTLYCIMVHNLLLWRRSDKFFFEHGDFPAALTIPQLTEVRKTSIARVLCDSGYDVKHIQPAAFFRQEPWNKPVSCKEIPGIDLNKWKDHWCPKDEKK